MATGTALLDFGSLPGKSHASVAVTGQAAIVSGSLVEAWIRPIATSDHTADEHMVETLKVFAAEIVAGVGFTIHGFNDNPIVERVDQLERHQPASVRDRLGGSGNSPRPANNHNLGTLIYGQWTIAWAWV